MSHVLKYRTHELDFPTINCPIAGVIKKIEKFRGRRVAGTGTPDRWLVRHDYFGTPIDDFVSLEKAEEFVRAHRTRLGGGCSELRIEKIPGKPDQFIEVPGSRVKVAGMSNLITTNGRELRGTLTTTGAEAECQIGNGTATEAPGDTALGSYDRTNDSIEDVTTGAQSTAPYFGWRRTVYRFDPPGTNDNYAEVGFSPDITGNLFSRARIKNAGVPTTIAVDADEWLDVTYELRQYPDHLTITSDTVSGYDVDILACRVNSIFTGIIQPQRGVSSPLGGHPSLESFGPLATLGTVTDSPGGDTNKYEGTRTIASYVASSYEVDVDYTMSISQSNFTGGIGCINFGGTVFPNYQVKFDPPIPKTASDQVDIGWTFAWAIATIP
jgi:hypothetical protein